MLFRITFFLLLATNCLAQQPSNSVVFKVRAPASGCSIICEDDFFVLEKTNSVRIKMRGKNKNIDVLVTGGKIMSVKDDIYNIRFTRSGTALITVYLYSPKGKIIIATKKQEIKNPPVFFCGIKLDSISRTINFNGANMYAYSSYYNQKLQITAFDMYYIEDSIKSKKYNIPPLKMKSDSCKVTPEMKKIILGFQPFYNQIYFHNIVCKVPDGSKRILDPIRLNIEIDTTNKEKMSLMYTLKIKIL